MRFRENPRAGADPTLPTERNGSGPGTNGALGHFTIPGVFDGRIDLCAGQPAEANMIQQAVIGLADHPIYRFNFFIAWAGKRVVEQRFRCAWHRERIRQQYRRLDFAQFHDLGAAHQFAKAISHHHARRDFILEQVASMGKNGCCAGANLFPFDQGEMPYPHSLYIGDGVQPSGR